MSKKINESSIEYTYIGVDSNNHPFHVTYHPGDPKEDGTPFTEEEIIILRDADHRADLSDRYWTECKSPLFEIQKKAYQNADSDDYIDPVGNLPVQMDNNPATLLAAESDDDGGATDREMTAKRLLALVKTLPADEFELFHELYENGLSMRAYAKKLGKAEGTIRYRHKKLLAKLKKLL